MALSAEDQSVQSMLSSSPVKWHLAHSTWFFEALILQAFDASYQPFDPAYHYLFNSYYEALGERQPRAARGLLTRPSLADVHTYREHVNLAVVRWLQAVSVDAEGWGEALKLFELGLHHEQQHQELLITDMLHALAQNPLQPSWGLALPSAALQSERPNQETTWLSFAGGIQSVGHAGDANKGFAFDNETPKHDVLLRPFALAEKLVSCAEYLAFIEAGGYTCADWWLSDGWALVQAEGWRAPMYWQQTKVKEKEAAKAWQVFGLQGLQPIEPTAAVTHLSFYEAAAYAAWAGARLPTEFEWEVAATSSTPPAQMHGTAWQWTRSSYDPYPGFRPLDGAVSEYNGKFMVAQIVLRGSSAYTPCAPIAHARDTYRNFFPASARWQCTGLRLAKDLTQ